MQPPTWTILIPTIGQRDRLFRRLLDRLLPQTEAFAGRVRVVADFNDGIPGLPVVRQRLVESVTTDYLSFIDDDDMVPEYHVAEVMAALESRPDYVGWQTRYISNGRDHGLVDHSLRHGGWFEVKDPRGLFRDISHINPMRSDVAKAADFRVATSGQVEDRPWVDQIRTSGTLRTETYIARPMYEYLWDRTVTAWRRPERIRKGFVHPVIDHPNFSWLEPPVQDLGRLAVIVPTRGRPGNVRKVIAAWDETNAWEHADLYLAVDEDDPSHNNYRYLVHESSEDDRRSITLHHTSEWRPMVPKLDSAASAVAEQGRHFAIAFAGDDHIPRTLGWARLYLEALRELGTGMVYGDDGYQGAKLSTEWAVTADAVRALGRMVPAPVEHLYCDNAMMDLFGGTGALRHLPDVRIEHMHPAAGKAKTDEQYGRVNSREQYAGDRAAYEAWRRTGLASQIEIIRSLRGDRPMVNRTRRQERSVRGSGPRRVERSGPSLRNVGPKSKFPFPPEFREIRGATPDEIAFTLADFAKRVPADQEIVELGVFQGRTAVIMAWGASQGDGAHVTAIDPWDLVGNVYDPPFTETETRLRAQANVQRVGYGGRVNLVHAFSADEAGSWRAKDVEKPVGLLFVDGDHTKEGARQDIEAWAPHLADGAVIAVDDYGHPDWPGVKQAVDELVDEGVLAPIELYHDRLAVTRIADRKIVAITSEGVDEFPVLREVETVELPEPEPEGGDDLDGLSIGEVRKIARSLGLKPVTGGIEAAKEQVRQARAAGA